MGLETELRVTQSWARAYKLLLEESEERYKELAKSVALLPNVEWINCDNCEGSGCCGCDGLGFTLKFPWEV